MSIPQHFAENGYVTRGFGKIMHPVCGNDKKLPGECDPKGWTLPYFHGETGTYWTCNKHMWAAKTCAQIQKSYLTVSPEEEAHMPLDDTLSAKAAATQLKSFKMQRETRPFFLGLGFRESLRPCSAQCCSFSLSLSLFLSEQRQDSDTLAV